MEKQKSWQFYLIIAVLVVTLYNILPTIFFYSQPLKAPIDAPRAQEVATAIVERVNTLEEDSRDWLYSFNDLLGIKPVSIELNPKNQALFDLTFKSEEDATLFKRFLPRAGALISFVPAQLQLSAEESSDPTKVIVQRNVAVRLDPSATEQMFQFTPKYIAEGSIAPLYRNIVYDRVKEIALAAGGPSKTAQQIAIVTRGPASPQSDEIILSVARELVDISNVLGNTSPIAKRTYAAFSQTDAKDSKGLAAQFITKMETLNKSIEEKRVALKKEQEKLKESGAFLDSTQEQQMSLLDSQRKTLDAAIALIQKNLPEFQKATTPLTADKIQHLLIASEGTKDPQVLNLEGFNPFIKSISIDWDSGIVSFAFYDDVQKIRLSEGKTEKEAFVRDRMNQYVINEIARLSRSSDETFKPANDTFVVQLDNLTNSQSFLVLELKSLAAKRAEQVLAELPQAWKPTHPDLVQEAYPIVSYADYQKLSAQAQKLGLIVYAPVMSNGQPPAGIRMNSIYVIARGMESIIDKYKESPEAKESQAFVNDFKQLSQLLQGMGFIGYPAVAFDMAPEFSKDYIFELNDYYSELLKATREDFNVKGSKRFAVLDFTDVEQRILATNRINDKIQEDLVKAYESYHAAQVDLNATSKYTVPAPTKNPFWTNFKLSASKYFTGDDRKVLKWGLDLSGGKTVRIALVDQNNHPVTDPEDLKQAVNELYTRINKMGVSERTIRIENSNILLDFPGSQGVSASELVKASAMYFHVVNEKFTPVNTQLAAPVTEFLQEVWNEAVVTNRKDSDSVNEIAWQHLGGDVTAPHPRSEAANILYEQGLRLANPRERSVSTEFDDTLSAVAIFRGADAAEWDEQTNPLIIVFHNYALEGSSLENIQAGYDAAEGNILMFGVKSSYDKGSGSPRDDFYTWTSQFAEDKISGTSKELYSRGRGWRMAVILNGTVITAPSLNGALRDSARISGRFSQREVNQLAADLKAGSLSFTPRILSEENVSPELGKEERARGITASLVALASVVAAMVGYYHFAGLVASVAVLLNIFIMWGVLQNLGAAMTLPGIAGIVLTIGMAVDANVLVFERIREEFKISGRIGAAIQAGYRKAFSAIIDSNITTIIAALILIQFDSGPIKGFAVTLIVGIISSMFTSLFMTRYFFAGWVKDPRNKSLKMAQFLKETNFDFLGQAKNAILISLVVMAIGTYFLVAERKTIFGMDFTGGYSLTTELAEKPGNPDYRVEAIDAFLAAGASRVDFEVRQLSHPNQLRIRLGTSMDEMGHPFYLMPDSNQEGRFAYEYQKDPRLAWVVKTLESHGLEIQPSQLVNLPKNWTIMSGQFSDAMRNNAILALGAALLSILIYITFRFEFKYAIGAVIGLAHDVFITLGILAMFHALGFAVQIDLQVIGAIMTIIGYSLNDTIIVFDRIREDIKIMRKMKFNDMVNHALNVTLSRTIMTSGTTILVLLALVLLGGQSIFAFSLVMTIGVIVGTLSSLFIASPVMIYFHNREERQEQAVKS